MVEELYPNVNVSSIGKSIEGRDLNLVTINGGRNLPKIFIDAGIHAREWISPASTLFFMDKLTKVLKRLVIVSTILKIEIISCFIHIKYSVGRCDVIFGPGVKKGPGTVFRPENTI